MTIHHHAFIHPKAHVDRVTVSIGARTKVWQFASIILGTKIGADCNVGACTTLSGLTIGNRTKISSGCVMGPGFKIGDDVFVGPNVVLANDCWPFADTDGYDDVTLRSGEKFAVIIEHGACIGANAVILPGVRIGAGAVVAAGAVVDRDVPAGMVFRRNGYTSSVPVEWKKKRMRWANEAAELCVDRADAVSDVMAGEARHPV